MNPAADALVFYSIAAMERGLDGSDARYADYYFAIYHCTPDEDAGINQYRQQLRSQFPDKVIPVGRHFVLQGDPACAALSAYYESLASAETLSDEFRAYAEERAGEITKAHLESQSLRIPIDLTEGQLASDHKLEFLTCVALRNGQVYPKE